MRNHQASSKVPLKRDHRNPSPTSVESVDESTGGAVAHRSAFTAFNGRAAGRSPTTPATTTGIDAKRGVAEEAGRQARRHSAAALRSFHHWAECADGADEAAKLLARGTVDVNALGEDGESALMKAAENACTEVTKMLLAAQADVNLASAYGETALTFAVYSGSLATVQLLLAARADINVATHKNGWTPLIMATIHRETEIALSLIEAGADTAVVDTEGKTALMHARRHGNTEVIGALGGSVCIGNLGGSSTFFCIPMC